MDCRNKGWKGKGNPRYIGVISQGSYGYKRIKMDNRYILYHNHIWIQEYGQFDSNLFCIHHIDNNRENNEPDNLIGLCPNHHNLIHKKNAFLELVDNNKLVFKEVIDDY